ncbi:alpha-ketoglutarate-dependent dioxygenase AlkB [Hahella sp. CCB-MM4]|uniref:alpha-ketoglutarate-dependent dioxygenase AlkB family protein n=1 Tax=Hahella sp. (strain CCB-MM4) TaxID=1926491 RepID=UPI000B9A2761|nr:alpha-ketoglutarate-dependent dioxygenase AlkB [Hahella sp. CCB-MM4]OZG72907.1 alpha-ketoglutarate-dependent dioxygenase AlkB [Hahella sp. CCB-MM4]
MKPLAANCDSLSTSYDIDDGHMDLICPVIDESGADIYDTLENTLSWRRDSIRVRGNLVEIPRLQAWYGEAHCFYTYSGLTLAPEPFPPVLDRLRNIAQDLAKAPFNCVLCNWYRDGRDSVGWHSDNEPELGINPVIASYSFGATRRFLIKPKKGRLRASAIELPHNSLLIMSGAMQHHWNHQVPKTEKPVGGRINLTFRYIQDK